MAVQLVFGMHGALSTIYVMNMEILLAYGMHPAQPTI